MTSRQLLWAGWLIVIAGVICMSSDAHDDLSVGDWQARLRGDRAQIELKRDPGWGSRTSFGVELTELDGVGRSELLEAGRPLVFRLTRDAGTIVFEGEGGRRASGSYTFEPSDAFVSELEAVGERYPDDDDLFRLVVYDVTTECVRELAGFGYDDLDAYDIVRLFAHGVGVDYVASAQLLGYRPGLDQVVRLHSHGVSSETIERFQQLELSGLVANDVIRLKQHGVQPDWVRAMSDVGFGTDDIDTLVRLRSHGIPSDYLAETRGALPEVSVDEVIRLFQHGVPSDDVVALVAMGYEDPTSLIRLRTHGVGADFVRKLAQAGYADLDVEEILRIHRLGLDEILSKREG